MALPGTSLLASHLEGVHRNTPEGVALAQERKLREATSVEAYRAAARMESAKEEDDQSRDFLWGVIWLIAGSAVTLVAYLAAAPGAAYFVIWAPMAYGGFRLVRWLLKNF